MPSRPDADKSFPDSDIDHDQALVVDREGRLFVTSGNSVAARATRGKAAGEDRRGRPLLALDSWATSPYTEPH